MLARSDQDNFQQVTQTLEKIVYSLTMAAAIPEFESYLSPERDLQVEKKLSLTTPFVCLNNQNIFVLLFIKRDRHLVYYRVGTIATEENNVRAKSEIRLGPPNDSQLGIADSFQAALNDNNIIIIVQCYQRVVTYTLGQVDTENQKIEWLGQTIRFGTGINPTVALTIDTAVLFYECSSNDQPNCIIGELRENRVRTHPVENHQVLRHATTLSVSANVNNQVVVLYRKAYTIYLWYAIGEIREHQFHITANAAYTVGYLPRLCLLNNGLVVDTHEEAIGCSLVIKIGQLITRGNPAIYWFKGRKYKYGRRPSIACNTDGLHTIEVHTTLLRKRLQFRIGVLREIDTNIVA